MLSHRLAEELMNLDMDEAVPLTRACGHYLNLSGIAELHHGCVCLRTCCTAESEQDPSVCAGVRGCCGRSASARLR